MVPEPVGSTHLRFGDARVKTGIVYVVTESCSESRMRSRTSRGALEWSGGKGLYMGSHILATRKVLGFAGIVPGGFRKVPEGSGGVQKDPSSP